MNEQSLEPGKYLNTLAFRCTPDLVGNATVCVRTLDAETVALWGSFVAQCRQRSRSEEAQPPYSIATTVLQVVTGGYVCFEPKKTAPFLVSRKPIDSDLLRKIFTLTHGLALGAPVETIDLRRPPELAVRIAGTPERRLPLAEQLEHVPGRQPDAPNWLYRSVGWGLAERLATVPFVLANGREITMRPDTTGGLVALDDPWENDGGGRYALCRTSLALKTLPNIAHPLLMLDARVSRISASIVHSTTALAVQPGRTPVLEVKLNGYGGARSVPRKALEALGRLEMDYSILRSIAERSTREQLLRERARVLKTPLRYPREHPGQIWPIPSKNYQHPIGTGVGMHHLRLLHQHAAGVFGDHAETVAMRQSKVTMPHRPNDLERVPAKELALRKADRELTGSKEPVRRRGPIAPSPDSLAACVDAAGLKKIRIVCLWYRDETRLRMIRMLCRVFDLDPEGLDPQDGEEVDLYQGRLSAVFRPAPDFLRHGPAAERPEALAALSDSLCSPDGILVGAWCETEYPRPDHFPGIAEPALSELDAKPQSKTLLARLDVPSQYLRGADDDGTAVALGPEDHPAQMALLDLFRSLGLTDGRITNAMRFKSASSVESTAHVGVHVRQQNLRPGEKGEPKIVITATALVPPGTPEGPWSLFGWSSTHPVWEPYRSAQNAFHAQPLPGPSANDVGYRQKWDGAADMVERALGDLADELDGLPYTVTVDAQSARRMWDGLQNMRLTEHDAREAGGGRGDRTRYRLPGARLGADAPRAVIRLTTENSEVPQPVSVTRLAKKEGAEPDENETSKLLFEVHTDFGTPMWILSNIPSAYDGSGAGRLGSKRTRWEAQRSVRSDNKAERRRGEMGQNYYAMTATEIFPLGCASDTEREALAGMTARLCHQSLSWSDRTRYPVPLHSAKQMDEDHPQYRREAVAEPGSGDAEEGEAGSL
ncbi:RNaseH domain-containing protein [Streptomyces clavifer]|uniref:RNaseH domain-containing protein n=1 Tax=Streptomyces clavifer TaxID=68188 RepID=UPI0038103F09